MRKVIITILLNLTFLFGISATKVIAIDPEAALQVSKGIAEWKLMTSDKTEADAKPTTFVSSSLSGMVEKGGDKNVGIISGLAAFDNDYDWLKRDSSVAIITAGRDTAVGIALGPYGPIYSAGSAVWSMWNLSNAKTSEDFYRATRGTPAWHLGAAVKILDNIKMPESSIAQNRTFKSLPPTFNANWKTIKLADYTYKYPSIDWNNIPKTNWNVPSTNSTNWSIPKTNWNIPSIKPLPTYTPSMPKYPPPNILFSTKNPLTTYRPPMPKMPAYTPPRLPPSSVGRRY